MEVCAWDQRRPSKLSLGVGRTHSWAAATCSESSRRSRAQEGRGVSARGLQTESLQGSSERWDWDSRQGLCVLKWHNQICISASSFLDSIREKAGVGQDLKQGDRVSRGKWWGPEIRQLWEQEGEGMCWEISKVEAKWTYWPPGREYRWGKLWGL